MLVTHLNSLPQQPSKINGGQDAGPTRPDTVSSKLSECESYEGLGNINLAHIQGSSADSSHFDPVEIVDHGPQFD